MRTFVLVLVLVLASFTSVLGQTTLINSGFETGEPTVWTTVNTASTNQWVIGSATNNGGASAAYISSDGGTTNGYDPVVTSTNHLYTPVTFPAGEGAIILSFDWRGLGEITTSYWDYIRVSLTAAAPVAGTMTANADQLPVVFSGADGYRKAWVVIPASYAGTTRNLVFSWVNDNNTGDNATGPAIDNVSLTSAAAVALTGTKSIPGDYSSLSQAIANLNAHGVGAGGVTFNIAAGSTFNETPATITATGTAANQIIFQKSGAGANPLVTASSSGNFGAAGSAGITAIDAIINIAGGDYITFNGIDVTSAPMKSGGSNIFEYGYRIVNASATDGAKNNTIKNTRIVLDRSNTSSYGIIQSSGSTGGGVTATAATGSNSNNKYYNIVIENSYGGINLYAGATTAANTDTNNEVGTEAGGSTVIGASYAGTPTPDLGGGSSAVYGINALNQTSVKIFNTVIRNLGGTSTIRGINLDGGQGTSNIYNNKVYGLAGSSGTSTSTIVGMELDLSSTGAQVVNAYNNFISDITSAYSSSASSTRQIKGILLGSSASTSSYNIDFNSVYIDGSTSPTISSVALEFGSSTPINNVRNNILANFTGAQTGVAKHYVFRSTSATAFGATSSVSNYNDLYIHDATNGFIGLANTTDKTTKADWTGSFTNSPDVNSITVNPNFNSATDLHISPSSSSVSGMGTALAGITTDIDGDTRLSPPDIGADEYTVLTGADMSAIALVSPATGGCYGSAETVTITIKNNTPTTHDFTTDPVTVTVNVTGAATYSSNIVVNTGTLAGGATQNVNMPATLNMTAVGTYTFNANTSVAGDIGPSNDAMTAATRTVTPTIALPDFVNFTGFTGTNLTAVFPNWSEGVGATVPGGTTSDWTLQSGWPGGNTTAKINLDGVADIDWLVGSKFTATANSMLRFDVAITDFGSVLADPTGMQGTDDKVIVRVSTDCGTTFTDLFTFDASNTASISNALVHQSVSLAAYAGQQVIIGFFASEGSVNDAPDYDFHIDNISIYDQTAVDLGAVDLNVPAVTGCYTATQPVTVTVRNFGSGTVDFATTPVTVTTNVTGAATATLTGTLNSGTLAAGATVNVPMSSTIDMTAAGVYSFSASTAVAGDGVAGNDAMTATTRTTSTLVTLPENIDFTGFTGSNLTTVFPNWRETSGTIPTGTTSSWTSFSSWPASNVSAKINLFSTGKAEWIVGPRFNATALSRLKFKVAITDASSTAADADGMTGTDDEVIVRVSTDCGTTYTDVYTFNASNTGSISNTLVEQTINLSAYAGQSVIVAFFASEGTVNDAPDYDFHIDDVEIYNTSAVDVGATALFAPAAGQCYSAAQTVTVTIKNYGSATLDFSVNPVTVTTNVTGAATATLTATVNSGTLAADATMNVNMTATLDMSAAGTYTFNASTTVAGDGNATNDAMTQETRTVTATVSIPQTVDFTGFTGSNLATVFPNWREASGATVPTGTTSAWTSSTVLGNTSAKVNLYSNSKNEWIVGPKFTATASTMLKFDVAITDFASSNADPSGMQGTDDKVSVMISTDCGATYTELYVFDAANTTSISNSLVPQTINLSAYAGQSVIVAFKAVEGVDNTPDYDFHIDNINIDNFYPVDATATALIAPVTKDCYSATETVTIRVKNNGTTALDFTTTPLTVTTNVTGATTATLNATVNTGTLASGATLDVNMSATLDMTTTGTYTFNASATVAGDGNAANDAMAAANVVTVAPTAGTVTSSSSGFCVSGTPTLTVSGNAGGSIQWQESTASATGPWTNVGTGTTTYTPAAAITATTYYRVVVSCNATTSESAVLTVGVTTPSITATTPATRCDAGTVTLGATASAGADVKWYTASTGGTAVHTGTSYTTPSLSSTTTYYTAAVIPGITGSVGAANTSISATKASQTTSTAGINFDILAANGATIKSVDIYPTAAVGSNFTVRIAKGATVIGTYSGVTTVSGTTAAPVVQTVPVNIQVPNGTGYRITLSVNPGTIRNDGGDAFPYTVPGLISLTSSTTSGFYYYMYNWQVTSDCENPTRTAVIATVDPATVGGTVAGTQTVCIGDAPSTDLVLSGHTGNVVKWQKSTDAAFTSPVDIVSTSATLTGTTIGTLTQTTYFRAVVQSGSCAAANSASVTVTVNSTVDNTTPLAGTTGGAQVCASYDVAASAHYLNNCNLIATVTPAGASPVSGDINACVQIDGTVQTAATGEPYVQRHYNITPASNPATATSTMTLYFLQSEFDAFNAARGTYPALPANGSDATGIANLRITQFNGAGTTPGTYPAGSGSQINPADASIVFNAAANRWEVSFSATGSGGFYVHTGNFVLPVTLTRFKGEQVGNVHKLSWTTATETNSKGFELQRSTDGSNFTSLGFIATKAPGGNSSTSLDYGFNDLNPVAGNNYYRLKQLDKDGNYSYSNVVVLHLNIPAISLSRLYPNPAASQLILEVVSPRNEKVTILVTDLTGKPVLQQKADVTAGNNLPQLNVRSLAAGTYMVRLVCANGCETATLRFVKQ